jgi:hypothetical protein
VRQWVLSVPKRLRYFMQRDGPVLGRVLRIFLRVMAQTLQANSPGATNVDKAALHIGAVAFIHRFGSSLNEHVHFHVCAVDGVFEEMAGDADADVQACAPGVVFHPATDVYAHTVDAAQTSLRKRILRAFVGRGLLEGFEAKEMPAYRHSGFSVNTSVCIAAHDRAGLERLLRYCARPAVLRRAGAQFTAAGCGLRRWHWHWHWPQAKPQARARAQPEPGGVPAAVDVTVDAMGVATVGAPSQPVQRKRPAHCLWAALIARIYEVLRGVGAVAPGLRRPDARDRFHHLQRRHTPPFGAHRRTDRATAHCARTRAAAVGRVRCADGRWCRG